MSDENNFRVKAWATMSEGREGEEGTCAANDREDGDSTRLRRHKGGAYELSGSLKKSGGGRCEIEIGQGESKKDEWPRGRGARERRRGTKLDLKG